MGFQPVQIRADGLEAHPTIRSARTLQYQGRRTASAVPVALLLMDRAADQHRSTWPRIAWRVGRLFVLAYLIVLLIMMAFENSFIYFPMNFKEDDWSPKGIAIEEAHFAAADGTKLHGWYAPHDKPTAMILFCHGNAGNITHRIDILRALHDQVGAAVLMFDYRGYGKSEGKPDEPGVLADARAARAWLAAKAGIAPERIVLMGESLGGAVAVDLAVDGARGLILENTFSSMPDVAAHHYAWLPVRLVMQTQFDSAAKIKQYHGPLFQSHGDRDQIVPLRFAQRLFDAANEPKKFLLIEGADHNDPRPAGYFKKLREFLDCAP
jgi:fermentation-respiration switch protein FrsA (DUF1100 family)